MSAALGLLRLQQVDSRLAHIDARLAEIQATLENDAELRAALELVRLAETHMRDSESARLTSETEAQGQQIKIQQAESSLYDGKVQNPKELQDLQADVASLKKHLVSIEDQELDAMQGLEAAQKNLQSAQENLARVEAWLGTEHRKLFEERDSLLPTLRNLQTERQAASSAVTHPTLTIYEHLRLQRRGVAVAEVSENVCGACGTTLTAALQQSARHAAEFVYCPSCGRILFAG